VLLPELTIPVSIETFETNFEYFFESELKKYTPNLAFEKSDIVYSGHRYLIYFDNDETKITIGITNLNSILIIHISTFGIRFFMYIPSIRTLPIDMSTSSIRVTVINKSIIPLYVFSVDIK